MRSLLLVLITFLIINIGSAQSNLNSSYLRNPDTVIDYVDSCATFWLNAHDPNSGGFFTNIDRSGNVITAWGTNKNMLTQTRNAYGFTRAYMLTGNDQYLQMAEEALNFLYQHAWDSTNGGWFGELDRFGNPVNPFSNKSAFDQHYALLGVAAHYETTGDTSDLNWLLTGYNHMESNLWDSRANYFGYYDYGNYNWSQRSAKSFNATVDAITTHLLYLYLLTEEQMYKDRLLQLADNIISYMVASMDSQAIGFVEKYDSDWNWDNNETMTIMGHVLKAAWCLGRIYQIEPDSLYVWAAEKLFDEVWQNGYDHEFGGPYKDYNRVTGDMLMWGNPDTAKAWWQMEQGVTAGLELYQITGDPDQLQMADETLDFFKRYFVDHTYGDVYENRTRYGAPTWGDHKGNGYKAAYHSIELGYYVYLYGKLFLHNQTTDLHYQFITQDQARDILLTPLAVDDGYLRIDQVMHDGQPYSQFDPVDRTLHLPAGVGGHFVVTYAPTSTALAGADHSEIPSGFELYQNYPNPFNPSTTISYRLSRKSEINVTIFNIQGQKVKVLENGAKAAGFYELQWDGTNQFGSTVASGVYLYELKAYNYRKVKRMVLLR